MIYVVQRFDRGLSLGSLGILLLVLELAMYALHWAIICGGGHCELIQQLSSYILLVAFWLEWLLYSSLGPGLGPYLFHLSSSFSFLVCYIFYLIYYNITGNIWFSIDVLLFYLALFILYHFLHAMICIFWVSYLSILFWRSSFCLYEIVFELNTWYIVFVLFGIIPSLLSFWVGDQLYYYYYMVYFMS